MTVRLAQEDETTRQGGIMVVTKSEIALIAIALALWIALLWGWNLIG